MTVPNQRPVDMCLYLLPSDKFTAKDVIASLNHHRGEGNTSAANALLTPVTEIKADGDHVVKIDLGAAYPRMIPDLAWQTPIFHPNISASGVVCLGGYGTHWVPSLNLDELCVSHLFKKITDLPTSLEQGRRYLKK